LQYAEFVAQCLGFIFLLERLCVCWSDICMGGMLFLCLFVWWICWSLPALCCPCSVCSWMLLWLCCCVYPTHLTPMLYLQVGNWQFMPSHLDRYWGILPSRSNGCSFGDSYTAVEKKQQNLLCWLPGCTDRSSLLDVRIEISGLACLTSGLDCLVRLVKQVIKQNITGTQSDPNTDVAYKGLQSSN